MESFTERRRAQLAGDLGDQLIVPSYRSPLPSPDGTLLAWISDRDGRPRAWVAPFGEEPAAPLDTEVDPTVACDVVALSWSPDGAWLAVQIAPGGGERTRVLLLSPNGVERREIAAGSLAVTLGAWSPSGRQVGVTIYGPDGDGTACLVDVRDGSSTVLASGPAAVVCAVSRDGRIVVVRTGRRGRRGLELIDLWTGRRVELLPGHDATVADARFGVTGSVLYLHTDAGRDRPALLACTVSDDDVSLAWEVAARGGDDLDAYALDPAGARAVLSWNVDGRSELELVDLRDGLSSPVSDQPGDVVTGLAFTRDGHTLLVASEGPTMPPGITRIALDVPLAEPVAVLPGEIEVVEDFVEPTLHEFRGEDGLGLTGWLFRPHTAYGAAPTLIWLHGGPEAQERPVFHPLFQALVAAGVQVFAPNVRGSAGFGRAFSQADDLDQRFTAITDVRAAVTFLRTSGLADPDRIGVSGRSYGGYLTLVALAWFPSLFAVGVDVCGMSDLETFYAETEPWIASSATTKYGDPVADRELLRSLSPIHAVDEIRAPLMVVHGRYDTNVPLGEALRMVAALEQRGATPRLLLFDDEGHETHAVAHRAQFVREVVGWVTAHLQEPASQTA
ncbi:prolyl oligopeptidase family serine peptidase [Pseudonocardia sp. WMMC193]|uniref:S9 family peptidase n=1 Tax=Pseudonocardia sp. WMMC193 TaxID=2911965 RepID=UPI001F00379A|nr:prolyl oligopeptidase family serine peptidase [Pseudonocardia sp. WMMC193]MCF7547395.1 prolyl oligopeptidase family serine peptidase [Pseudonocardia sp. WMMC193]MCF7553875.1 prolyl oligopeptidase family serine peptidase [Pseudonocardia sp. WMMC193]MCF7553904.1 prolyl oligopeptidase family serine peptidase [Pseudonocardia sp. WMMC193]MCF7553932.1 prolyl oligopeptidase family serine peptidase [Pseudonocardia sp. WMMC193]